MSVRQLSGSHFLTTVDNVLRTTGISPQHLELEITESMMIEDAQHIHQLIAQIRTRGIKVALDDFGTGYSSLSSLQQLPIDKLKIDRSFVFGVDSKEEDRLLVEMIINLGKLLGYTVIAEGVETIEQQHVLQSLGCDMVQGYYYSRPLGGDAWQAYLLAH
ncbi:EAL domain-containing protein [Halomonas sp. GFAJ-1]|uniref:EAL domain-containing protein n=1 Tax=Halomonas sp. GFAJ-1 TaxID=1118153 RepID=UPI001F1EABC7|nr:EAL domain-containing protein [Halomonas sp. GFAJ-1]